MSLMRKVCLERKEERKEEVVRGKVRKGRG